MNKCILVDTQNYIPIGPILSASHFIVDERVSEHPSVFTNPITYTFWSQ